MRDRLNSFFLCLRNSSLLVLGIKCPPSTGADTWHTPPPPKSSQTSSCLFMRVNCCRGALKMTIIPSPLPVCFRLLLPPVLSPAFQMGKLGGSKRERAFTRGARCFHSDDVSLSGAVPFLWCSTITTGEREGILDVSDRTSSISRLCGHHCSKWWAQKEGRNSGRELETSLSCNAGRYPKYPAGSFSERLGLAFPLPC